MNKKILVRCLKNGWKREGLTDRISIRQAEAWMMEQEYEEHKLMFEIIDDRVEITKEYHPYMRGIATFTIKFKKEFQNDA